MISAVLSGYIHNQEQIRLMRYLTQWIAKCNRVSESDCNLTQVCFFLGIGHLFSLGDSSLLTVGQLSVAGKNMNIQSTG